MTVSLLLHVTVSELDPWTKRLLPDPGTFLAWLQESSEFVSSAQRNKGTPEGGRQTIAKQSVVGLWAGSVGGCEEVG
jgi:hypothetical protein